MKHALFLCTILLCYITVSGQAYDSAIRYRLATPSFNEAMNHFILEAASNPADTGEEKLSGVLERRKLWMSSRMCNDVALGEDMAAPKSSALVSYMAYYNDYCPGTVYAGNWKCIGPFRDFYGLTEYNGRIDAIWVHPTDTNHILIGANGGGLWKTNTGGRAWHCITDGAMGTSSSVLGMAGVQCIAVNPSDTNMMYIAQGGREQSKKSYNYGLGMVYTTNGGVSWHTDAAFNTLVSTAHVPSITKVAYMPGTQKLFAISETKVLYKPTPSDPWEDITPTGFSPSGARHCFDMEFTHAPTGKLVVSFGALSNTAHLCTYDPSTDTWAYMPITLTGYTLPDYHYGALNFSLSATDNAYMQIRAMNGTARASLLIKSPITTYSQNIRNSNFTDQLPGASMLQVMDFMVSPANSDIIYVANYNAPAPIRISTDEGATFFNPGGLGHADGNCLFIHSATNTADGVNDVVYIGNDGGVRKKRYGTTSFAGITGTGLCVTQFFGFGNTEADDRIMLGGAQDVGTWAYRKHGTPQWALVAGGDGYTAKFAKNGLKKAFGESNGSILHPMFGMNMEGVADIPFGVYTPTDSPISNINRPQYFDLQNTAHVGYSYIWKKAYNPTTFWDFAASTWERAFTRDPINYDATHAFPQIASDFYIDENNANKVYIAYRDAIGKDGAGVPHDYTTNEYGKLYISNDANHPTDPGWTNITPSICIDNGINTITVDPENSARIWVGFGNINNGYVGANPDTMKRRVWYSSNSGATWTDVSKGLSALPVNKLLYRKGSNDELYAGTDAGVFKWNRVASQWECFNNQLPPCTVMDMEFNYCAGKLRVGTFGRGIWETPLPEIPPADEEPIEITSGTTNWSTEKWLQSSVLVKAGAILAISGTTIHMPAKRHIMVEPGGKLYISSSRITNSCEACMWGGIQAWGNAADGQDAIHQAVVRISNNSVIEHAKTGLTNYNPDPAVAPYASGGIVQVLNSTFLNNAVAVNFQEYHNQSPTYPHPIIPNVSYFHDVLFQTDNGYKGMQMLTPPTRLVSLSGIEGIYFRGCKFINKCGFYRGIGDGIVSENAGYSVVQYCPLATMSGCSSTPQRSLFRGLTNGVFAKQIGFWGTPQSVSIDQADFDTTSVGVKISVQQTVSVSRCQFKIGRGIINPFVASTTGTLPGCGKNIGILTENALVFRIEGNTFLGQSNSFAITPWYNFGVMSMNPGNGTNRVYKNSFTSLTYGVFAQNDPYSGHPIPSIGYGVQVSCNDFVSNTNDMYSTGVYPGLGTYQKGPTMYGDAGNTFSGSVKNIVNTHPTITIKYLSFSYPSLATSGLVGMLFTGAEEPCNSTLPVSASGGSPSSMTAPPTALNEQTLSNYKSTFYAAKANHITAVSNYENAIDLGNTDSIIQVIDTSSNMNILLATLTNISPYLSGSVLKEAAIKLSGTHYADMVSLLEQNPEAINDYNLLTEIADIMSMDGQDFDDLWAASTDTTVRTTMENSMRAAKASMEESATYIMMALRSPRDTNVDVLDTTYAGVCLDTNSAFYLVDTNSIYHSTDSVDQWLQNIGTLQATYERVGLRYFLKDYSGANVLFNSMSTMNMTSDEQAEYNSYDTLWDIQYNAALEERSIFHLNEAEIAMLDTAGHREYTANAAKALVNSMRVNPATIYPCTANPPVAKNGRNDGITPKENSRRKINGIKVYPNPSTGAVTFEYAMPAVGAGKDGITITILNVLGEQVMELQGAGSMGKVQWDAGPLPSGVYMYLARNEQGIVGKGKVVLVR